MGERIGIVNWKLVERYLGYLSRRAENPLAEQTRDAYRADLCYLIEFAENRSLQSFVATDVVAWVEWLGSVKGLCDVSRQRKLSVARGFFAFLCRNNLIAENPVGSMIRPVASLTSRLHRMD